MGQIYLQYSHNAILNKMEWQALAGCTIAMCNTMDLRTYATFSHLRSKGVSVV